MPAALKNVMHRQGQRCDNEEDRRVRYLAAQLRYATQEWHCNVCNTTSLKGNKSNHLKSKKHLSKTVKS
jgi:ribosomal protein L37AE/L43A